MATTRVGPKRAGEKDTVHHLRLPQIADVEVLAIFNARQDVVTFTFREMVLSVSDRMAVLRMAHLCAAEIATRMGAARAYSGLLLECSPPHVELLWKSAAVRVECARPFTDAEQHSLCEVPAFALREEA